MSWRLRVFCKCLGCRVHLWLCEKGALDNHLGEGLQAAQSFRGQGHPPSFVFPGSGHFGDYRAFLGGAFFESVFSPKGLAKELPKIGLPGGPNLS